MKYFTYLTKKIVLSITLLTLGTILILWQVNDQTWRIHAQADYMAPGVPYKATCYTKESLTFLLNLQGPHTLQVNRATNINLILENTNNKEAYIKNIFIKLEYSPDLLRITKININKNICNNSLLINNNTKNGTATFSLSSKDCGEVRIKPRESISLAIIKVLAINQGNAFIKIDTQDTANGSKLLINSTATVKSYLQTAAPLNILIKAPAETTPIPPTTTNISPTPTPPNTGLLDTKQAFIGLTIILGIAIGLNLSFKIVNKYNIKPIIYVEE